MPGLPVPLATLHVPVLSLSGAITPARELMIREQMRRSTRPRRETRPRRPRRPSR